mmetsp:Transcript_33899/g.78839  ORF Transcript_33899/g.78839 Transcript_33899/m.78839 type:complete len:257 (+) Transcript_33899:450-1220(+)
MDGLQQLVPQLEDRQAFTLLLDRLCGLLAKRHRLADVKLLPLRQLVLALPKPAECLRDGPLPWFRSGIFPWSVHVFGDGVQQALLHGLTRFAPLLGQSCLGGRSTSQTPVRLLHDLDWRELQASLRRLPTQEDGLLVLHFDLEILLHVALREQAVLLVAIQALVVLEYARVLQLPSLPHLVLRELLLLTEMLLGRLVICKLELDPSDLPNTWINLPLPLAHGVGRIVLVAIEAISITLLDLRLQILTCLLINLTHG